MKTSQTILLALIFFITVNTLYAQTEAEQKVWMEYMTPGPEHEQLAKCDGEWSEEVTFWMDPTAEPMKMKSVCINKMILGGRYQYSTHTGTMMGMPFEGISIVGFDNAKKVYQSSWIDNMGTGVMNLSGPLDESTKSVILTGTSFDPQTGKDVQVREVFKIIDDKTQSMEMYMIKDGKEMKSMEIVMTKK